MIHFLFLIMIVDERFFQKFWMSRDEFKVICDAVRPYIEKKDTNFRKAIPVDKIVAVAITILKGCTDFSVVSDLYGIGLSTVSKLLMEFCNAIQIAFKSFIKFPGTEEERAYIASKFLSRWQFPNTFGVVDGTHIAIVPPNGKRTDYYNYKSYYSINVLAICNHEYKFM